MLDTPIFSEASSPSSFSGPMTGRERPGFLGTAPPPPQSGAERWDFSCKESPESEPRPRRASPPGNIEMTPPHIWMGFSRATLTRAFLCSLFSRNVTILHAPPRERADRS